MRKKIIFVIAALIVFMTGNIVQADETDDIMKAQEDSLGITDFIQESNKYTSGSFSDIDIKDVFDGAITGSMDNKQILKGVLRLFGKDLQDTIKVFGSILVIIVINSILNCITEGLENKSVSQIAFYVQYILIITIALTNFSSIINLIKESVNNMTAFMNMLIPIMMTLIISTGSVTTASMIQPVIIFMISLISNFINNVAIPLILVSTALGIVSKISDKVQVDRLAKRLKSSTIWIIGMILTVFVTVVSVNGSISGGVDAVTSKTAKTAVSNLIPIVGKILGDAMDSVLSCSNVLKSAIGAVGTVVVIAIVISPVIKLFLLMSVYYIGAAVCEPIADKKVIQLLDQMGDTFKVLFAILCSMSVMVIIGTTLVIKISNVGGFT